MKYKGGVQNVEGASAVYAADLDGDGDMDVLSASYDDNGDGLTDLDEFLQGSGNRWHNEVCLYRSNYQLSESRKR